VPTPPPNLDRPRKFDIDEVDSDYVDKNERYVVSLIVTYDKLDPTAPEPEQRANPSDARDAAAWALDLTRDANSDRTTWVVYDRELDILHRFEQGELHEFTPIPS